jgi:hypothetical protein
MADGLLATTSAPMREGVPPPKLHHPQVVLQLLGLDHHRGGWGGRLLKRRDRHRQRSRGREHAEHEHSSDSALHEGHIIAHVVLVDGHGPGMGSAAGHGIQPYPATRSSRYCGLTSSMMK